MNPRSSPLYLLTIAVERSALLSQQNRLASTLRNKLKYTLDFRACLDFDFFYSSCDENSKINAAPAPQPA